MKKIIFIIAIVAFVGCKEEAPTEPKINLDKEYTLEELENDTNWVEVTDIDTVLRPCVNINLMKQGVVIRNEKNFNTIIEESFSKYGETENNEYCYNDFEMYNIDTNTKSIILFTSLTNMGPKITRKIFKHNIQDFLVYYNKLEATHGNEGVNLYMDFIKIPKTKSLKFNIVKINL